MAILTNKKEKDKWNKPCLREVNEEHSADLWTVSSRGSVITRGLSQDSTHHRSRISSDFREKNCAESTFSSS